MEGGRERGEGEGKGGGREEERKNREWTEIVKFRF